MWLGCLCVVGVTGCGDKGGDRGGDEDRGRGQGWGQGAATGGGDRDACVWWGGSRRGGGKYGAREREIHQPHRAR